MRKTLSTLAIITLASVAIPSLASENLCQLLKLGESGQPSQQTLEPVGESFKSYQGYLSSYNLDQAEGSRAEAFDQLVGEWSLTHQLVIKGLDAVPFDPKLECSKRKAHFNRAIENYAKAYSLFRNEFLNGFDYDLDVSKSFLVDSLDFCKGGYFKIIEKVVDDIRYSRNFSEGNPPKELLTQQAYKVIDLNVAYQLFKVETVRVLKPSRPWSFLPVSKEKCWEIQSTLLRGRIPKLIRIDRLLKSADESLQKIIAVGS